MGIGKKSTTKVLPQPLGNLLNICDVCSHSQAWFSSDSPLYQNPELDKQINTALDYWLHKDPRRKWWWDAIGAPGMLSQIMLMRDGHLSDFQMTKGGQNLERAILGTTGQNLVWQAEITARRAVIQRDADLLRRAFELIASEIRISDDEGIQPDFSFHQHKQVKSMPQTGTSQQIDPVWCFFAKPTMCGHFQQPTQWQVRAHLT